MKKRSTKYNDKVTVYEYATNKFLLIPKTYVLRRGEQNEILLSVTSNVDIDQAKQNHVFFNCKIAPNILTAELVLIRSQLFKYCSWLCSPSIIFPESYFDEFHLELNNPLIKNASLNKDNESFSLSFEAINIYYSTLIIDNLKNVVAGISGEVKFEISNEIFERSSIIINLNETIGENVLGINTFPIRDKMVLLTNKCESNIELLKAINFDNRGKSVREIKNDPNWLESPIIEKGQREFEYINEKIRYDNIDFLYRIIEDDTITLQERNVEFGEYHTNLRIDCNVDFQSFKLVKLEVMVYFPIKEKYFHTEYEVIGNDLVSHNNNHQIVFPLADYLATEKRFLKISIKSYFLDGSIKHHSAFDFNFNESSIVLLDNKHLDLVK